MDFVFGGISTSATRKSLTATPISNIVQIDNTKQFTASKSPYVLVLLDTCYSARDIQTLKVFLAQRNIHNYKAVVSLNCYIEKDKLRGELSKFYRTNQSRWKDHLHGAKRVLAVGPALYSITESSDLLTHYFYDKVFNKTYFWSPDIQAWVFPIDSFVEGGQVFLGNGFESNTDQSVADTYKTRFITYQINQLLTARLQEPVIPEIKLVEIKSKEEFVVLARRYRGARKLSWDLETSGFDSIQDRIGCITMSFDGVTGYFIPWHCVDKEVLDDLLLSVGMQIGANLKFDVKFLWRNGVKNARVDNDVVQLGHLLNERRSNSLKALTFYYTPFGGYDRALDRYREKTGIDNFLEIPQHILMPYATKDAIFTYIVHEKLQEQLEFVDNRYPNEKLPEWTIRRYYEEIMMPAVSAFAEIEYRGVHVDRQKLLESRLAMQAEIEKIERELFEIWSIEKNWGSIASPQDTAKGRDFDFNSPKHLGRLFFFLGWESMGDNKYALRDDGTIKETWYGTSDFSLERWRLHGHPELEKLQRLRSLKTILKTFISNNTQEEGAEKGWERYLRYHKEDNSWRMHPTFNVMRTESGRCRSDSPNMQNIPAHDELSAYVKKCITTPNIDEYCLATADYASLQIRLAAVDTNINDSGRDESLYNVYTNSSLAGDLHSVTAFNVFAANKDFELDIIEIEDSETGKKYTFFEDEVVKTKNRGEVKAKDLEPNDVFV
jgi:DNA polymerase I-like protein with 3'-5' exonuclease and polymerase domains